jgi:hypothetical protein
MRVEVPSIAIGHGVPCPYRGTLSVVERGVEIEFELGCVAWRVFSRRSM